MHIPDGFLSPNIWLQACAISAGCIGFAVKKSSIELKEKTVPLMGVMSAFIFAAQMLNFPVAGGTSGHLLGGVLAAVLLGPYIGAVVISVVLAAQCVVFQDGGLTALGTNVFNMAVIGTWECFFIYYFITKLLKMENGSAIPVAVAAWCSVVLASAACSLELYLSGISSLKVLIPAMLGIHSIIGIGEAVITVLIILYIKKVRPDLIYQTEKQK